MAGKSTILRQTALIALHGADGLLRPRRERRASALVDRIFTRVGASDDLARGQSTFMVEMTETATILHNATDRSLVILDEIGRGTSTFDGLSIAWAVAEHIHGLGARTLFATHYHELDRSGPHACSGVANYNVAVKKWQGKIIFLRRLVEGGREPLLRHPGRRPGRASPPRLSSAPRKCWKTWKPGNWTRRECPASRFPSVWPLSFPIGNWTCSWGEGM